MMSDFELPGDPEGGMFGLRRAVENGPPPKPEAHARLAAALTAAMLRKKRRGRRPANWRSEMRRVVWTVLDYFPNATSAHIARLLHAKCLSKEASITVRTIENWVGQVRKLKP